MTTEAEVDRWLRDDQNPGRVFLWTPIKAAFFQVTRGKWLTLWEWIGASASALFIALPTFGLYFFDKITGPHGALVVIGMWAIKIIQVIGSRSAIFKTPTEYFQTENLIERMTEVLDQNHVSDFGDAASREAARGTYITAILSIMELAVRQLVNARKGQVTVTFARYCEGGAKIDISHRNRGCERMHKIVDAADFILAHRVCQTVPQERVVHDLNAFPERYQKSPTRGKIAYRSFYIIPLPTHGEPDTIMGFVSIDCDIPYGFHGNRAKFISAAIAPLAARIPARLQ